MNWIKWSGWNLPNNWVDKILRSSSFCMRPIVRCRACVTSRLVFMSAFAVDYELAALEVGMHIVYERRFLARGACAFLSQRRGPQ
jgi:hypothetical protein